MARGNPRCQLCHGAGGRLLAGIWRQCECVRVTAEKLAAQRKLHETPGHEYKSLSERWRDEQEGR